MSRLWLVSRGLVFIDTLNNRYALGCLTGLADDAIGQPTSSKSQICLERRLLGTYHHGLVLGPPGFSEFVNPEASGAQDLQDLGYLG
jgi:hypothetical protein